MKYPIVYESNHFVVRADEDPVKGMRVFIHRKIDGHETPPLAYMLGFNSAEMSHSRRSAESDR